MFNLKTYAYFEELNPGLIKHAPKKKTILDVGCGSGLYGQELVKLGNKVVGIDSAKEVQEICNKRLNKFYLEDITSYKRISKVLNGQKFDGIVFADVLEHIPDPVYTLEFYTQFLNKNGIVYISLPNVAVWYVRLMILFGKFDYTETGVMDKTHLRFFTKNNILRMLSVCKLKPKEIDIVPGIFVGFAPIVRNYFLKGKNPDTVNKRAVIDSPLYSIYMKYVFPVEYVFAKLIPGLFAFKFIVLAKKT